MKKMKSALLFVTLAALIAGCRKSRCKIATITQSGTPCAAWGIKVNTQTFPADSIPLSFRTEGSKVCVDYELYEDMRMCVCCGGTWAKIISMRWPDE